LESDIIGASGEAASGEAASGEAAGGSGSVECGGGVGTDECRKAGSGCRVGCARGAASIMSGTAGAPKVATGGGGLTHINQDPTDSARHIAID
jgi:hypothetical protein